MRFLGFDLSIYDSISYFQFSFQWFRLSIVVNRVEIGEKRIEINKKDLIYLYTEYFVTFSRDAKYTSDFVNYRTFHFFHTVEMLENSHVVYTQVEFIFTIEGRNTNFGMAERGGGWRPEIFIVAMTTPLVRATVSINVIAIC